MKPTSRRSIFLNAYTLCFSSAFWFYLILYAAGLVNVREHGLILALALFAAAAAGALTSPFVVVARESLDEPQGQAAPRAPSARFYTVQAIVWFVVMWGVLRVLEAVSVHLGNAPRWPVSGLFGALVVAAIALFGTLFLAGWHWLRYRREIDELTQTQR